MALDLFFSTSHGQSLQVQVLELLQGLAPDTLRQKAKNGASVAHDAAFQGTRPLLRVVQRWLQRFSQRGGWGDTIRKYGCVEFVD
jgi:hypothetical protein